MNKNNIIFLTLLSAIIGIGILFLALSLNGTTAGIIFKFFLLAYWNFATLGFFLVMLNYDNLEFKKDAFFIHPLFLFVPAANFVITIGYIGIAFIHRKKHNKTISFTKEKNKMVKKYSQLASLNALKEIYEIINNEDNVNADLIIEKPMSRKDLKKLIIFLEKNYKTDEYSKLLLDHEFSFIKLISIFKESIANENIISDEIFIPSKKLLQRFSNKVYETQQNIFKNGLLEKEMKNNIEVKIKYITRERLINEINEEIKFLETKNN